MIRGTTAAALALLLCTTLVGCDGSDSGGGSADTPADDPSASAAAAADVDTAAAYAEDLAAWSADVVKAGTTLTAVGLSRHRAGRLPDLLADAPELAPAGAEDPPGEYTTAAAIADRVDGIVDEMTAYAQYKEYGAYYDVYDADLEHYSEINHLLSMASIQASHRLTSGSGRAAATRDQIRTLQGDLGLLRRYDKQLATVAQDYRREPMQVSAIDYHRSELDWLADFQQEYVAFVRKAGYFGSDDAYHDRWIDEERYFAQASNTPLEDELTATRRLASYLKELGGIALQAPTELPASAPTVGDLYRWEISRSVAPTGRSDKKTRNLLTDQLWRLYRLRELEDTSDAAYQQARDMLLLQTSHDPRSPYETMIAAMSALRGTFPGQDDPPTMVTLRWAEEQVNGITAPPLATYAEEIGAELEGVESIADDIFSDDEWDRMNKRVLRIMGQAAKDLDDHPALTEDIEASVEATRPTPEAA